jgi:hypothetical protein
VFGSLVPDGKIAFIEREIVREERFSGSGCTAPSVNSKGYEFDETNGKLTSPELAKKRGVLLAYGETRKVSGNSNSFKSSLLAGKIPFETEEVKIRGVNKVGDASLSYKEKALVLGVGDSYSEENNSTRISGNCSVMIRTVDTIKNHGFVKTN